METRKHRRDYGRTLGRFLLRPFKKRKRQLKYHGEQASLKDSRKLSTSTFRSENAEERAARKKLPPIAPPSFREVFSPQSNINLLTYVLLALHSMAYDQLLPVFLHLPPQSNRSANPEVRLPFKFAGGFGVDVSVLISHSFLKILNLLLPLVRAYRSALYDVLVNLMTTYPDYQLI